MNIVFFSHPHFLESRSMPKYAQWLQDGMISNGHSVSNWSPKAQFSKLPAPKALKKWLGYLDQYFLFPFWVKKELNSQAENTLFVFTDHALGPWVPLVGNRPHIVHCHDFLAQKSALGIIPENKTGWSGRIYQLFIRNGYKVAKNFISISKKTQFDLHQILDFSPLISEVVYNGLTENFHPKRTPKLGIVSLNEITDLNLSDGYILHVGGNQWYKNRRGVIEVYNAWRKLYNKNLPLIMIGPPPSYDLQAVLSNSEFSKDIHFLSGKADDFVMLAYQFATAFLFPSLAEGFGWPIAEAMASGVPVITTNEEPMSEVASNSAFFINKRPFEMDSAELWAIESAIVLENVISLDEGSRNSVISDGLLNVQRFNSDKAIKNIENIYLAVLEQQKS